MRGLSLGVALALSLAASAHAGSFLASADFALDAFRRGRFAELDATLDGFVRDDVRMDDANRAVDTAVVRLASMLAADETLLPRLSEWRKSSRRPWAELAQARYEEELAFDARGRGSAGSVPPEAWPIFHAHLEAAEAALGRALAIAPNAPEPRAERVRLALFAGKPRAEIAAHFEEAIAADPRSIVAQEAMYTASTPAWGGSLEMAFAFARGAARRQPDDPYVRVLIVRPHEEARRTQPAQAQFTYYRKPEIWQEVSAGAEVFVAALPESEYGHNLLALLALRAGQRDVLRRELKWIGERRDPRVWEDDEFGRAVSWAAAPAAPSGAGRRPPPAAPVR